MRQLVQPARLRLRLLEHGTDAPRELLEPLGGLGGFLAERRRAVEVLRGLVERALPLLELLPKDADPLLELIELRGTALECPDRAIDGIDAPLRRPDRGR